MAKKKGKKQSIASANGRGSQRKSKKGRKSKKSFVDGPAVITKISKDKKRKSRKSRKSKKASQVSSKRSTISIRPIAENVAATTLVAPVQAVKSKEPCTYTIEACGKNAAACQPNRYPGILSEAQAMAVIGSECGSYSSLCKLLRAAFRCAERVFTMTPWGNYVVFRQNNDAQPVFFIYNGCSCNVNRFRYMDLTCGTAGLLYFEELHDLINYIIESRESRVCIKKLRKSVIDEICQEFCEYGDRHDSC